jgi:hypothetical protein
MSENTIRVTIANRDALRRKRNAAVASRTQSFIFHPPDTDKDGTQHTLDVAFAGHLVDYMSALLESGTYLDLTDEKPRVVDRPPSFVRGFGLFEEAQAFAHGMKFILGRETAKEEEWPIYGIEVITDARKPVVRYYDKDKYPHNFRYRND